MSVEQLALKRQLEYLQTLKSNVKVEKQILAIKRKLTALDE